MNQTDSGVQLVSQQTAELQQQQQPHVRDLRHQQSGPSNNTLQYNDIDDLGNYE